MQPGWSGSCMGQRTMLAKMDLHHAYRVLPVHADDHPLLEIQWDSGVYVDTALPFGLRSAPKIFSAFADALAWALRKEGVVHQIHYLGDFLFDGPPQSPLCKQALARALALCKHLGLPVAMHKTEAPATQLTFLGIQIDTAVMELSLAQDKLLHMKALVLSWRSKKAAPKWYLQSLIGHLSHATTVVQQGRTFLRRMIHLMKTAKQPHHQVRLSAEFHSDLQWWCTFLPRWNGRSLLRQPHPSHTIPSDASGSWGCGAFLNTGLCFQLAWPDSWTYYHIAAKEMVPVVIAIALWGRLLSSHTVLLQSDNMTVVVTLTSGSAKDPHLMHPARCLHFFLAEFDISIEAQQVPGLPNTAADALTRNQLALFFRCTPQANPTQDKIPRGLVDMLLIHHPDWLAPSWRTMFCATLGSQ